MLKIDNLHARVAGKDILKGLTLDVKPGEVHAIMGPNGAGKSTLGNIIAGRDGYEITEGSVSFEGRDLLALEPEERAALGVFLAFQYPVEIPGVNNTYFLRSALNAQRKARGEDELDSMQFLKRVREKLAVLHLKDELLHRGVNEAAARRSATRSSSLQCWNRNWRSSTRPTPASISMR
jgi:Fe-S cluster assembly ATP-binding protein